MNIDGNIVLSVCLCLFSVSSGDKENIVNFFPFFFSQGCAKLGGVRDIMYAAQHAKCTLAPRRAPLHRQSLTYSIDRESIYILYIPYIYCGTLSYGGGVAPNCAVPSNLSGMFSHVWDDAAYPCRNYFVLFEWTCPFGVYRGAV